jgi:hypothetical protein
VTKRILLGIVALGLSQFPYTASAQLTVPPFVADGGHQKDPLVFAGYLDATLYGAVPDEQLAARLKSGSASLFPDYLFGWSASRPARRDHWARTNSRMITEADTPRRSAMD